MARHTIVEIAAIIAVVAISSTQAFQIVISHCNDVSGQMESFERGTHDSSKAPVPCKGNTEEQLQKCIGGLANVAHWLHETKEFAATSIPVTNVLRLISGNLIGGESGWLSVKANGWEEYGTLVKDVIKPSAVTLGMKEFGAGLRQTITYIESVGAENFTLINTCESSYENEAEKEFCTKTNVGIKEIRVTKDDDNEYAIGIVGFVSPTVERLSLPGNLSFSNVATKVKSIIAGSDIKTFIVIGDGNLALAKQIIDATPKVKLVVYGSGFANTNTNSYPLKYGHGYIATAGRWGSSVGKLLLDINESNGDISVIKSLLQNTTYPDQYNEEGSAAASQVSNWRGTVNALQQKNIGYTRANLIAGEICWRQECNLGNLMTDAVVHCVLNKFITDVKKPFEYPLHSVWHGGAFFEDDIKGGGGISEFDVHKWLPYHNHVHLVKVKGEGLRQIFQASASGLDPARAGKPDWRQFLQISNGLEVYYNDTPSDVPKVDRIRIVHDEHGVPRLMDIKNDGEYYLAIPTYLYQGRGVYEFVTGLWLPLEMSVPVEFDDSCLKEYIKAIGQVSVGLEERIWINNDNGGRPTPGKPGTCETKGSKTAVTVILTIVFFSIFLAVIFVGYFYVLPRLRSEGRVNYPPNQL